MITLLGMSSPNVRKVVLMLEELDAAYALRHVAVFRGEQFAADFLAVSPLGKVPVLLDPDHGRTVFESGAILLYLAETRGRLLPPEGAARYDVIQWLMVQMSAIGPTFGQHNHFQLLPDEVDGYAAARYRAHTERLYRQLDTRLAARDWLAGDAYSIADIATYPWALYLERHGFDAAEYPALVRWRDRIAARPAAVRAAARVAETFEPHDATSRRGASVADIERLFARRPGDPPANFAAILE